MSCSAFVPWEVSSTQAPITDKPKYFTFACAIFCYFAAHPTVHFLPSRKFCLDTLNHYVAWIVKTQTFLCGILFLKPLTAMGYNNLYFKI